MAVTLPSTLAWRSRPFSAPPSAWGSAAGAAPPDAAGHDRPCPWPRSATILSIGRIPTTRASWPPASWPAARDGGQRVCACRPPPVSAAPMTPSPAARPPGGCGAGRRPAAMAVLAWASMRSGPAGRWSARSRLRGPRLGGRAARRGPARRDPYLRPRGDDLPPTNHIGGARWVTEAWGAGGPAGTAALRDADRRADRALRRPVRGVGHLHDRGAPGRTPERDLALHLCIAGAALTASSTAAGGWPPQKGDVFAQVDLARFEAEIATESLCSPGVADGDVTDVKERAWPPSRPAPLAWVRPATTPMSGRMGRGTGCPRGTCRRGAPADRRLHAPGRSTRPRTRRGRVGPGEAEPPPPDVGQGCHTRRRAAGRCQPRGEPAQRGRAGRAGARRAPAPELRFGSSAHCTGA